MKLLRPSVLAVALCFGLGACASDQSVQNNQSAVAVKPAKSEKLQSLNWDSFNKAQLDQMITQYGKDSPNYDPAHPPYVVFDWDNTSIFLDIQEAVLSYQLINLEFGATPAQLNQAIRMNISSQNFDAGHNNAAGQPVNIDKIAPDIIQSYTWLYNNYEGFKGKKSLAEVQKSPHYMAFVSKMRYLYEAIGDTFDHATSYPWVTYMFTGMTEKQVRDVTARTVKWQMNQPVEGVTWTTPASLPGKAGVVSMTWNNGVRVVPEMQNLYKTLRDNGFDVWVCSASFVDVIKEFSSNPEFGYNNPENRVLAMELERDKQGRIQPRFRAGYDQTQGKGKTKTIERFLVSKYGYGPIFIAGDSEGDQNMMQDFTDTKKVLIINRLRSPSNDIGKLSKIAVETYGKADAKYLLQGRNDNTGDYVKSQKSYKFGSKEARALK
ncbi:hypothetical protein [Neisseria sp. Ec49-e6-T10]|uniref:hypothetical protein n=1 Tax=Neisseria sp. Ec49-e6-T10 TaxID=3140744 RepID=UPI003EBC9092